MEIREIPEREWLQAGFFWIGLGLPMALPWVRQSILAEAARFVFCLTVVIHIGEAFYNASLARRANLDPYRWAIRSLFLGYLALRRLRAAVLSTGHPM